MDRIVLLALIVLFFVTSIFLPKIGPNLWIGYRLPWTLKDAQLWNRTHTFAARVVPVGCIACLPLLAAGVPLAVSAAVLLLVVLLPVPYSVRLWRIKAGARYGRAVGVSAALIVSMSALLGALLWHILPRTVSASPRQMEVAGQLVQDLAAEQFGAVTKSFDETMKGAESPAHLAGVWHEIQGRYGALHRAGEPKVEAQLGYVILSYPFVSDSARVTVRVVLNADSAVSGLWIRPE